VSLLVLEDSCYLQGVHTVLARCSPARSQTKSEWMLVSGESAEGEQEQRLLAAQTSFLALAASCPARQRLLEQAVKDTRQLAHLVWASRGERGGQRACQPDEATSSGDRQREQCGAAVVHTSGDPRGRVPSAAVPALARKFIPRIPVRPVPSRRPSSLAGEGGGEQSGEHLQASGERSASRADERLKGRKEGRKRRLDDMRVDLCASADGKTSSPQESVRPKESATGSGRSKRQCVQSRQGGARGRRGAGQHAPSCAPTRLLNVLRALTLENFW
jgi:hypothetical protein